MPEIVVVLFIAAMALVVIWPMTMICRRVGFSPWLGIFAAVPLANVALLWFLALSVWPKGDTSPRSM
jgi:hypothetical protein